MDFKDTFKVNEPMHQYEIHIDKMLSKIKSRMENNFKKEN